MAGTIFNCVGYKSKQLFFTLYAKLLTLNANYYGNITNRIFKTSPGRDEKSRLANASTNYPVNAGGHRRFGGCGYFYRGFGYNFC